MAIRGYYFITDATLSRAGNLRDVKDAVAADVRVVQYRNKPGSTRQMYTEALRLRRICKDITFLINDRVDIALAVGADGVHLGADDMPYAVARKLLGKKKIIGVTVHSLKEAKKAQAQGADYLGVSPIFSTKTKPDAGKPKGPALIRAIKKHVTIPLVAVGGINLKSAAWVVAAGADGLCAISAVVAKSDCKGQIEKFQELFKRHARK